jgi:hypothetical protein
MNEQVKYAPSPPARITSLASFGFVTSAMGALTTRGALVPGNQVCIRDLAAAAAIADVKDLVLVFIPTIGAVVVATTLRIVLFAARSLIRLDFLCKVK